ncbi:phage terminase large subunit family protein, partial [Actinobacillus equuli subsp. equuli]
MYAKASEIRKDIANLVKAPIRMSVSDAVEQFMRVPMGGAASVKWDRNRAPYIIEPMNCLNSREYDSVVFVGP